MPTVAEIGEGLYGDEDYASTLDQQPAQVADIGAKVYDQPTTFTPEQYQKAQATTFPPPADEGFTNISQEGGDFLRAQAQASNQKTENESPELNRGMMAPKPTLPPDDRTALGTLARSTVGGLASGAQSVGGTLVRAGGALPGIAAGLMSDLVLPAGPIKDAVDKWATNRLSQAKDAGNFVLDNAADTMKRVEGQNKGAPLGWMGTKLAGVASSAPALLAGPAAPAVFALEAAARADKAADDKGVTGFDKASNVAMQAGIAGVTGKLMQALGGAGAKLESGAVVEALNALKTTAKDLFTMKLLTHAANQITEQGEKPMSSWGELADLLGNSAVDTAIESGLLTAGGVAAKGIGHMAGSETTTRVLDKAGLPNDNDTSIKARHMLDPKNSADAQAFAEDSGNRADLLKVRNALAASGAQNTGPDETIRGDIAPEGKEPTGLPPEEADKIINSISHPTPLHIPDAEDQFGLEKVNTYGLDQVHSYGKADGDLLTHVPGGADPPPVNERDFTKQTSPNLDEVFSDFEEHAKAAGLTDSGVAREVKNADVELTYPGGEKVNVKGIDTANAEIENAKRNTDDNGSAAQGSGIREGVPASGDASSPENAGSGEKGVDGQESVKSPPQAQETPSKTVLEQDADLTGIKNEAVGEFRKSLGKENVQNATPETNAAQVQRAIEQNRRDPASTDKLIEELKSKPRALKPEETFQLQMREVDLKQNYRDAMREWQSAFDSGDKAKASELFQKANEHSNKLDDLEIIAKQAGTESGRSLQARQRMMAEDYSLANMVRNKTAAKGRALTPEEHAVVMDQNKRIETLMEKVKKLEEAQEASRVSEPSKRPKAFVDALRVKLAESAGKARERLKTAGGKIRGGFMPVSPGELADAAIVGAHLAVETGFKLKDWSAKMMDLVGERVAPHLSDLWDRAHGILHEHLKAEDPNSIYEHVEALLNPDKRVGAVEKKAETARKNAENDLNAAKRGFVGGKGEKEGPALSSEKAESAKAEAKSLKDLAGVFKRKAEVTDKLAEGDFSKTERQKTAASPELEKARDELRKAQAEYKLGVQRDALAHRTGYEKFADGWHAIQRFMLLTGVKTLGKLGSAAASRTLVQTPLEEVGGGVISKALPGLAAKAHREGGLNLEALAKSITQGALKGFKEIPNVLKTGQSEQEVLHGKPRVSPEGKLYTVAEAPGRVHQAEKTPTKYAEIELSTRKRITALQKAGVDVNDPLVQAKLKLDAYKDGQRAVFMQDNVFADKFNQTMREWQKSENPAAKAASLVGRTLLPITKIPSNFLAETANLVAGLPIGGARAALAYKNGIEKLAPEQADSIMRQMKKGLVGAGFVALGYAAPQAFGGFYQPHSKKNEDEANFMGSKVGDKKISPFLLHNPLIYAAQFGSTLRKVADSWSEASDAPKGLIEGTVEASLGLAEESPFVKETLDLAKMRESDKALQHGLGNLGRRMFIPRAVQEGAQLLDEKGEKYKARSYTDEAKLGLPWLRQNVGK